jgi:hypothetical protein
VVVVAAAVEDHPIHADRLGSGRDQLAYPGCPGFFIPVDRPDVWLDAGRRRQGVPGQVINELHGDVPRRTVDHEARTLRGTAHLLAQPEVPPRPRQPASG